MSDEDGGDGFISRWSRRKREVEREPADRPAGPDAIGSAPAQQEMSEAERQRIVDELPDVESLSEESDFAAFMREGVPDELRQRALRRLWRLNPVFANLDGLNDYDLDYTDAATVVKNLKSAWQVGRGYLSPEDESEAAAPAGTEEKPEGGPDRPTAVEPEPEPEQTAENGASPSINGDIGGDGDRAGVVAHTLSPEVKAEDRRPRKTSGQAARRRWG
jgi:hypothetical protein